MQALILDVPRELRIIEFPQPERGARNVHGYDGSSGRRIPPLMMGHEAAGQVVRFGPGATRRRWNLDRCDSSDGVTQERQPGMFAESQQA